MTPGSKAVGALGRRAALGRECVIVIVSYCLSPLLRGSGPRLAYQAPDDPRRNQYTPGWRLRACGRIARGLVGVTLWLVRFARRWVRTEVRLPLVAWVGVFSSASLWKTPRPHGKAVRYDCI